MESDWRERLRRIDEAILSSVDFWLGLFAFVVVLGVGLTDEAILKPGRAVLIAEASIGAGLTAIVLGGLSIFVTFFDNNYRRVLEAASSMYEALFPYRAVAYVSGAAALIGIVGAATWAALSQGFAAVVLALGTGVVTWALAGSVQLVRITSEHAQDRADVMRAIDTARAKVKELRGRESA